MITTIIVTAMAVAIVAVTVWAVRRDDRSTEVGNCGWCGGPCDPSAGYCCDGCCEHAERMDQFIEDAERVIGGPVTVTIDVDGAWHAERAS